MSAPHNEFNPHAAPNPDLLRSALANHNPGRQHLEPGDPEHTGYISGIVSGVATPRPSGTDKRLPGILHNFFGQVGVTSLATHPSEKAALSFPYFSKMKSHDISLNPAVGDLTPTPISPQEEFRFSGEVDGEKERGMLGWDLVDERSVSGRTGQDPASPHPAKGGEDDDGRSVPPSSTSPVTRPTFKTLRSGKPFLTLHARESTQQAASDPISNVSSSPVLASHLSNPTSPAPYTIPNSPAAEAQTINALTSLTSHIETIKLTDGTAHSDSKATPPITPRTLSNEGSENLPKNLSPSEHLNNKGDAVTSAVSQATRAGAPVPTPKGKLIVTVSAARGLRPSYDPYAVCVFEWIESIAQRPSKDDDAVEHNGRSRENSTNSMPIKRAPGELGRAMAIPMRSRQSSTNSISDQKDFKNATQVTDPEWDHEAVFDVVGNDSNVDIDVYDRANQEAFLGHVNVSPDVFHRNNETEGWFRLEARDPNQDQVTGEIHLKFKFERTARKKYGLEDFEFLKLVGKGTFGQVYQVRKKDTQQILALKMLSKKVIIQKKEVEHTIGERNILVRTASADSPFIVGLKYSFQTATDLFLVTGFMSGGELFNHLQKAGRFDEARAKFYIAELILALQHLHQHDIVYRDLKPENILLDANGHIALCDFGLSKANLAKDETTNTFCGTTEYLAPEVLLDEQGYTKMVDFWSLGVLVFEMCCGWSPFYAEDTQQMYKNIAFGKVRFPKDTLSTEGRNFVKGLLNRNPRHRLGARRDAEELKEHPFFADTDWDAIMSKSVVPPFKPKLKNILDVSNFDPEFTEAYQTPAALNERATQLAGGGMPASTPLSPGMQANFQGFTFTGESNMEEHFKGTELEKMDEDVEEDADWEHVPNRMDRMSGIIKTGSHDDGIFNNGHFDM